MTARGQLPVDWNYEREGQTLADFVRALWEAGYPAAAIWRRVQELLESLPEDYRGARTVTPAAVQHLIQNRGWAHKQNAVLARPRSFPPAELVIETEKAIVTSDWHVPHHHRELLGRMLNLAKSEKPDLLVVAGDFLDVETFSLLPIYERPEGLKEELNQARDIVDTCLELVPRIAICIGNHETRFVRALRGEVSSADFGKIIIAPLAEPERVLTTGRGYVILKATRGGKVCGTWRVTHPLSYSRVPPQVERQIAARERQHVLGCHGHLFALGVDVSGRLISGQIGGMVDPALVSYRAIFDTTHPSWIPGFWYLKRGTIHPMTLLNELTDWELFSRPEPPNTV